MRSPLFTVLLLLAFLSGPPIGAEEPSTKDFMESALGKKLLKSFSPEDRNTLRRYTEALLTRTPGSPPFSRCFAPGTPPLLLQAYHALDEAAAAREPDPNAPQAARQLNDHWSTTATNGPNQDVQGLPITLTWSIVADGTDIAQFPAVGDSDDPSDLRAFLSNLYGGDPNGDPEDQPYFVHFLTVFANVSAKTGVTYVYEENDDGLEVNASNPGVLGVRGDIRICGHDIDGNSGTLAYNHYPDRGDMVIDTDDDWLEDSLDDGNTNAFPNLIEHEHGHGLGLEHVCPLNSTKLMEPTIRTSFRGIQFDDIYSIQRHYGDFFEKHNSNRNNDSIANAVSLPVVPNTPYSFEWLSIDDDSDIDYYAFEASPGALITIRVIPSSAVYPEGRQKSPCNDVGTFDSTDQQNLSLALLAPDTTTTLATGPGTPAGQTEDISSFVTSEAGTHYIVVDEGNAGLNACQLYRLEVVVALPQVTLALTNSSLVEESFLGQNGNPDPGETARYDLTLKSVGNLAATNTQATLTGPAGFTGFDISQNYGTLATPATATHSFVFALEGLCDETIALSLDVTADGGYSKSFPLLLTLGSPTTFEESADLSPAIPPAWTSSSTGDGSAWVPSTAQFSSATRSFFADDLDSTGSSTLESPPILTGPELTRLSFSHLYDTEHEYDGGVLEISIDGAPWQDFVSAGGTFTANGYVSALEDSGTNPLRGRQAWHGDSGDFLTTTATLPAAAQNLQIRLRWVLGHDKSIADVGWYVDDIVLSYLTCDTSGPALTLSSTDTTAGEFTPLDTASVTLSTPLPSLIPLPALLQNAGSADHLLDVSGLANFALPAGQISHTALVTALPDGLPEGPETLDLSLGSGSGTALLTIADAPYGHWAFTALGSGPGTGPYEDFEGDGLTNIEEYSHQTDPGTLTLTPDLHPRVLSGHFRIEAPFATLPADVLLGAESSPDLLIWSKNSILTLPDGFEIPLDGPIQFLRLTYELLSIAP